jgi:hypothetical protein
MRLLGNNKRVPCKRITVRPPCPYPSKFHCAFFYCLLIISLHNTNYLLNKTEGIIIMAEVNTRDDRVDNRGRANWSDGLARGLATLALLVALLALGWAMRADLRAGDALNEARNGGGTQEGIERIDPTSNGENIPDVNIRD